MITVWFGWWFFYVFYLSPHLCAHVCKGQGRGCVCVGGRGNKVVLKFHVSEYCWLLFRFQLVAPTVLPGPPHPLLFASQAHRCPCSLEHQHRCRPSSQPCRAVPLTLSGVVWLSFTTSLTLSIHRGDCSIFFPNK